MLGLRVQRLPQPQECKGLFNVILVRLTPYRMFALLLMTLQAVLEYQVLHAMKNSVVGLIIMRTHHTRLCRVNAQMSHVKTCIKVVDLTALWLITLPVAHPVVLSQIATTTNPALRVSLVAV
eukprot:XP_011661773.1 PREDICTED: uncharacterized protein LOC105437173 [Strongylocentrotus purpuratus]